MQVLRIAVDSTILVTSSPANQMVGCDEARDHINRNNLHLVLLGFVVSLSQPYDYQDRGDRVLQPASLFQVVMIKEIIVTLCMFTLVYMCDLSLTVLDENKHVACFDRSRLQEGMRTVHF